MLKLALLLISLSLISCGVIVPEFPEVWQCGYSAKYNKFGCVNTTTQKFMNLRRDDPSMEGAQCLSIDDYRKSAAWVESVKKIAETRCR